jgi:hypothetical protein
MVFNSAQSKRLLKVERHSKFEAIDCVAKLMRTVRTSAIEDAWPSVVEHCTSRVDLRDV